MTLVLRLITLLTIGAASFAMPITCAQNVARTLVVPISIAIPVHQQLDAPAPDLHRLTDGQHVAHGRDESFPGDCGKTAPRAGEHPATLATTPAVPGYLGTTPSLGEASSRTLDTPPAVTLSGGRAGPPDVPPPRLVR